MSIEDRQRLLNDEKIGWRRELNGLHVYRRISKIREGRTKRSMTLTMETMLPREKNVAIKFITLKRFLQFKRFARFKWLEMHKRRLSFIFSWIWKICLQTLTILPAIRYFHNYYDIKSYFLYFKALKFLQPSGQSNINIKYIKL